MVIFRGINVDYFDSKSDVKDEEKKKRERENIDKSRKIILLPGRLTAWKGQEIFIETINKLKVILSLDINLIYAVILGE